jgi:hypothetical protein
MNAILKPPIQKYLEALELELKRHSGVSPEDALSDAREYLQNQQDSLLRAEPSLDDDALYARFVESFGPPPEVAAAYAESAGDEAETPPGYAPGWRICCTTCGRSAPLEKYGVRIGAASYHKYTLGYCRGCRWIRWMRVIKDADYPNLTERLGTTNTPDHVRQSLHRPWLVLVAILAVVLSATLVPWFFVAAEAPATRQREFIRLVVGADKMTLQGEDVTWDQLRDRLASLPRRQRTVIEFAVTSANLASRDGAFLQVYRLVQELGFEYLSDTGVHSLGARGSPPEEIAVDPAPAAKSAAVESVKPSGAAASVVEEWMRLVLANSFDEADKLTDFPRRADATHDVRDPKLLTDTKLEQQFTRDQAVVIVSGRREFDRKRGKLVFLLFRSPGHSSGWLIREADFVDERELAERVATFAAPVLLGQEIERTLGKDMMLDLESGRIRVRDLTEDRDHRKVDDALKWLAVRGLDVQIRSNPNQAEEVSGLALLGNVVEVDGEVWKAVNAQELEKFLEGKLAMNSVLEANPDKLPATYVFRSHGHPANEPYIGVLQILGVDQARLELRFKYRLVGKSHPVNG